jgi:hypothetical protein
LERSERQSGTSYRPLSLSFAKKLGCCSGLTLAQRSFCVKFILALALGRYRVCADCGIVQEQRAHRRLPLHDPCFTMGPLRNGPA